MGLKDYKRKRNFGKTPEPSGFEGDGLRYVIHLHRATRLHYDLRLEVGGVLKSWAVPKGPSLNPTEQRLAVRVEDHPMEYGEFEGLIPEGNYGAGAVVLWDEGVYVERSSQGRSDSEAQVPIALEKGHLTLLFYGRRLRGEFALVRSEKEPKHWLLVKKRDEFAEFKTTEWEQRSVRTGRTLDEVQSQAPAQGAYWGEAKPIERELPKPSDEEKGKDSGDGEDENLPRRFRPMLAVNQTDEPNHPDWFSTPGWDGFRVLAEVDTRGARIYTKAGIDFSSRFPSIPPALKSLGQTLLLDGEIVVLNSEGVPDSALLKGYRKDRKGKPVFLPWDLLHAGGKSLRGLAAHRRWEKLQELEFETDAICFPRALADPLIQLWRHRSAQYFSGTSALWRKVEVARLVEAEGPGEAEERPKPRITHPEKVLWPEAGYTKGDLIAYYESVASVLLPHLKDRPQSLHRHPHGIAKEGFFHKDITEYVPKWVKTVPIHSDSSGKTVNYLLVQNEATLLFLANYGCIELNPWFSRLPLLDHPDFLVIDLDPDGNPFGEVVEAAQQVHSVLNQVGAQSWCKTSGATGLHICVPLGGETHFDEALAFAVKVTEAVHERLPKTTSVERSPARRRGKIYLDAYQNRRSQTLASVYCLRPRPGAPASTPLHWEEVVPGLDPNRFTLKTLPDRLAKEGDLWKPLLTTSVNLARCLESF